MFFFFFSSRRRHTRLTCDWSSDVCSSDLPVTALNGVVFTLSGVAVEGETWNASVGNGNDASYTVGHLQGLSDVLNAFASTSTISGLDRSGYVALRKGSLITVASSNTLTATSSRTLVGHAVV